MSNKKQAIQALDNLHRMHHGMLLKNNSKNKLFFTDEEFESGYIILPTFND